MNFPIHAIRINMQPPNRPRTQNACLPQQHVQLYEQVQTRQLYRTNALCKTSQNIKRNIITSASLILFSGSSAVVLIRFF